MSDRPPSTIVVTGGNAGLGLETVRSLAATGAGAFSDIVVASRHMPRARQAVATLRPADVRIHVAPLDLASLSSVRQFPAALAELGAPPLGALVCNAGVQIVDGTRFTEDRLEETFAVNVVGHFALVKLLLADFTPQARLLFISSGTHDPAIRTGMPEPVYSSAAELAVGVGFGDVDPKTLGRLRYTTSKLCDIYLAYEFAKRYPMHRPGQPSLVAAAMDPGLMAGSGLARDYGPLSRFAWNHVLPHVSRFMKGATTPAASGAHVARLVAEPSFGLTSGGYFIGVTAASSSVLSYDQFKAVDLWSTCATLTGLDP